MNKAMYLFNKIFSTNKNKLQDTVSAEADFPRGGGVGDRIPIFKVRDQMGKRVNSEKLTESISKLIFLSDSCASCNEVLKQLTHNRNTEHFLVIKGDADTYSNASVEDSHYKFPIIRSTKIVDMFGIKRVPAILTLNTERMIERVDEVADIEHLNTYLEK